MKRRLTLAAVPTLGLAALSFTPSCAAIQQQVADMRKSKSEGLTGCLSEEMEYIERPRAANWTIQCHGRTFSCGETENHVACHERLVTQAPE